MGAVRHGWAHLWWMLTHDASAIMCTVAIVVLIIGFVFGDYTDRRGR
ncbi:MULTISPECIES: hypothetical protein [Streptomyces]